MSFPTESIRILLVEDAPADAELAQREIKRTLQAAVFHVVETREDFLAALESFQPDLIVSDYRLPHFDGLMALQLAQEQASLTPVIILTGAINEDTAVECMKAGAADYVIKEHLKRLGQAVTHALKEKQVRQERRQAEEALRESEERCRTLFETMAQGVVYQAADGQITAANPAAERILGLTLSQMRGRSSIDPRWRAIHEDGTDFPGETHPAMAALRTGREVRNVVMGVFNPSSNNYCWLNINAIPQFRPGSRTPYQVYATFDDITERKQAEEALRLARFSLERASEAIYWLDEAGRLVDVNETAYRTLGYTREELLQLSIYDIDPEMTRDLWCESWQTLKQMSTRTGEFTHRTKDGRFIPIEVTANYIEFGGRALNCAFAHDITVRKQAEETRAKLEAQLRQAQKMESVGRLAGGIAHDFNNLLTVIQGHSIMMHDRLPAGHSLREPLEVIQHASERAAALTRQLLAFSRKQFLAPTRLDLNELVTNLRKMLERLIGEDISLSTVLQQPDLWPITADPSQLEQVIVNLAVNARDAMPTGGFLTIETKNVYVEEPQVATHPDISSGPYALLTVSDTGHGMDEYIRAHLFEPFFTTKEVGQGTGLGLAMVYGIVKQSGGDITVYSEPGQGATFKIYLPAQPSSPASVVSPRLQSASRGGSETVLLVEDEEAVRELVRETLQEKGYIVLEARHGSDALSLVGQHQGQVDLLLTDVVMPQMSGRELADWLKILHPQAKVLFMSGYTDDAVVRHGLLAAEVEFLPKPFLPSVLVAKVREVLDK